MRGRRGGRYGGDRGRHAPHLRCVLVRYRCVSRAQRARERHYPAPCPSPACPDAWSSSLPSLRGLAFKTELDKYAHLRWVRYATAVPPAPSMLIVAQPTETRAAWPTAGLLQSSDESPNRQPRGWARHHIGPPPSDDVEEGRRGERRRGDSDQT